MVKKEELYTLIHSLSKSEKRYFTLSQVNSSETNNYLRLFNLIEHQDKYDEREVKNKFKGEKFIDQLHVTKNYLAKRILKSLRNYHSKMSKQAMLHDGLRNLEILFSKELYYQCETELKKLESITATHELLIGSLEVAAWRRKLEQALRPHSYDTIRDAIIEQERVLKLIQNSLDYWHLAIDTSANMFSDQNIRIRNKTLLESEARAMSIEARILFSNTVYLNHLDNNDNKAAEESLHSLLKYLEKHQPQLSENPGMYLSSINNLISFMVFNKEYDNARILIQKAKSAHTTLKIGTENKSIQRQVFRTINIELEIFRVTKSFHDSSEFLEYIENIVSTKQLIMPREYLLSFWFQLASIYFMKGEFSVALRWINHYLAAPFRATNQELLAQIYFLNLMVHLEHKNFMVLRYFVDSTRRLLRKTKNVQEFERILLKFFTAIGRLPVAEHKAAFHMLKNQLFPVHQESAVPSDMTGYIDYKSWIDSNLSK